MKHKLSAKLVSVLLAVIMVVSIIPVGMIQANAAFSPRLSAPAQTGWYANYGRGNQSCVGYARCRASEILGYDSWKVLAGNAYGGKTWWNQYCNNKGVLKVGQQPRPGSLACWEGHVAVVEVVSGSTITISEGHSSSRPALQYPRNYSNFIPGASTGTWYDNYTTTVNSRGTPAHGGSGAFKGYIYLTTNGKNGPDAPGGDVVTTVTTPPNSGGDNTHYNASASCRTGTYVNNCGSGIYIRNGVGKSNSNAKVGYVPNGSEIYVTETNGNWGRTTFNGATGWTCLDYYTFKPIPIPAVPGTPNVSASDIAKGKNVTISWAVVSGASGYKLAIRGAETKDIDVGNTTSYTYQLNSAATYNFHVLAYNVSGSSAWSGYRSCTAHNPVTVNFVDWDDSPLTSVQVTWGESAKAPDSPYRKGYTFQGWNDSYFNVKTNKTIKATYKINTYIVNFFDREGVLIESQKVTYGSDATPPTDTHATARYQFRGWSSTDYINVYTDRADKNINIDGIYSWDNYELPVECTVQSAERQYDGYTVVLDIENNDSLPVTGRAVVALKTAEGKLVDMTESTAFSIKAGKTKEGLEVFLPCTYTASQVEVFMVANYSSGVPISSSDTATITKGQMFAESKTMPDNPDGSLTIEPITKYRYRDKQTTTGNSKTLDGWTWNGTKTSVKQSETGYQDSKLSTYDNDSGKRVLLGTRSVATYGSRTKYEYYHWRNYNQGSNHVLCPVDHGGGNYHSFQTYSPLSCNGSSICNGSPRYGNAVCPNGCTNKQANNECWWQKSWSESYQNGSKTQYNYATYTYSYNFERWTPWTEWSDTEVSESTKRQVESEQWYRYETKDVVPEDNSGVVRQYSGNLGSEFAGKQVTLYVYGYTGASDYTNVYIGQTTVDSNGHYAFTYKLREEPTEKTGDFTVAIGVEGSSDMEVVDTIEAPKPTYTVNFYDWDGSIISTQEITKGENATPPTNPSKEGFKFLGWDKSVTNITEDTDIFADFEREEYTVVFVDWENQTIKMEKFSYGDILVAPEAEEVEGYDFIGWDALENGKQYVTEDMIVTAQYEKKEYTVNFLDENGDVIESQAVKYDESALPPEELENDDVIFAGWYNPDAYEHVNKNISILPIYWFEETTQIPVVNHESGEYSDNIQLTLSSEDENAVIYYYLNGNEDAEQIYTKPIKISKTCSVTYHAESLGKNNSDEYTQYYCINTSDKPSEWMLYKDLPDEVKSNPADFTVEQETGYSYKDVETTSSPERAAELTDDGWSLAGTTYTDYTPWQDEAIEKDTSKLGFEIEVGEAPDTTTIRYRYSHFKYTENGVVKYAPRTVAGFDCVEEFTYSDTRLPIVDFLDDGTSYYEKDGQTWFNQSKVNGVKSQYRSRYKIAEYYKWTGWTIERPAATETREKKSDNVYRYYNKNYHIIQVFLFDNLKTILAENNCIADFSNCSIEGYDLEGLYYDDLLTNRFDLSTPITESITLYANFTPKQYTVTFQMQDGTELDTQTVDYMSAATAPDTDSVPGWVFAGWDKDFSSITEDTVVTGRYVRESEYARISLSRSTYNMYSSTKITLEPTITPKNLSESKVEWTSSDTSVAIVDENGNVTAIGAGEAIITVTVLSSREKAECKVIVKADLATTITLKSNSKLNYDDLGFLRRIKYKTDVDTVAAEFENSELSFYKVDGTKLAGTDFVGTGAQIKLFDGDNVIDSKTVVVTGDLNGDGIINNRDVAQMNRKVAELIELEDYQAMAFDANGDGSVDNKDAALIARFLVGKEAL